MKCNKCGTLNESNTNFCSSCGNKLKKKNNLKIILIIIITIIVLEVLVTNLAKNIFTKAAKNFYSEITSTIESKDIIHTKEELLNTINNLDCTKYSNKVKSYVYENLKTTNDNNKKCNLENKYTVLNEEMLKDNYNRDMRKINLKLKNYDIEFSVTSSKKCTATIESNSCVKYDYMMTTDYHEKAAEYFYNIYKSKNMISECNGELENHLCSVRYENQVDNVAKYIMNYVNYLNTLDIRFNIQGDKYVKLSDNDQYTVIGIEYTTKAEYRDFAYVLLKLSNGQYVIEKDGQILNENSLKEYIINRGKETENFK